MRGWSDEAALANPRIREAYDRALGTGPQMAAALLAASGMEKPKAPRATRTGRFASKTEAARWEYHEARRLAGEVWLVIRQPTIDLPGGVVYRPDLMCFSAELFGGGHAIEVEEVKGSRKSLLPSVRESIRSLRIAAGLWPWIKWSLVERERGGAWKVEVLS